MRHLVFFAIVLMAAQGCNALYGYGEEETADSSSDSFDVSDTAKGDDPYPTADTTALDSNPDSEIMVAPCNPVFPEGTRADCLGMICTISWDQKCQATCADPDPPEQKSPWVGTATPEAVQAVCVPLDDD